MNKAKNNKSKKAVLIKALILILVSVAMFILTPLVFRMVGDALALTYPLDTACGSCEFGHDLRARAGAAGASFVWGLSAFILLIGNIIKLGRLHK